MSSPSSSSSSPGPAKSELRAALKRSRLALPVEARMVRSRAIAGRLAAAIDWKSVRTLHYFEPIEQLGEVDLQEFTRSLKSTELYTSRKIGGAWRIVSSVNPENNPSATRFDAILVPMLGFDSRTLHRVGYGGGYYDRLLAAQPQAHKIGVCFEQGKVETLPAEAHDVPLDLIVTESQTYTL